MRMCALVLNRTCVCNYEVTCACVSASIIILRIKSRKSNIVVFCPVNSEENEKMLES